MMKIKSVPLCVSVKINMKLLTVRKFHMYILSYWSCYFFLVQKSHESENFRVGNMKCLTHLSKKCGVRLILK